MFGILVGCTFGVKLGIISSRLLDIELRIIFGVVHGKKPSKELESSIGKVTVRITRGNTEDLLHFSSVDLDISLLSF